MINRTEDWVDDSCLFEASGVISICAENFVFVFVFVFDQAKKQNQQCRIKNVK